MQLSRRDEAWMREQIPLPVPREEVAEIGREYGRRCDRDRPYLLLAIGAMLAAMLLAGSILELLGLPPDGWRGRAVRVLAGAALLCVIFLPMKHFYVEVRLKKELRRILRERGHEVCVPCGYCLAGLGDDVKKCPECGAKREAMPLQRSEDQ